MSQEETPQADSRPLEPLVSLPANEALARDIFSLLRDQLTKRITKDNREEWDFCWRRTREYRWGAQQWFRYLSIIDVEGKCYIYDRSKNRKLNSEEMRKLHNDVIDWKKHYQRAS